MRYSKNTRFVVQRTGKYGNTRTSIHRKKTTAMNIVNKAIGKNKPVLIEAVKITRKKVRKK